MAEPSKRPSRVHSLLPRLFPQLPDEISILCIARVPRFLHPTLALVSRSWRSLLNSPLLFSVRSDLGLTQPSLCVSVLTKGSDNSKWYFLDLHPQNPRPLLPLPQPPIDTYGPTSIAIGPTIFVLGGSVKGDWSPEVQIFDARLNRWSIGPRMGVSRVNPIVEAIDGKIYALSGCRKMSDPWAEVLDMELGLWAPVPTPVQFRENWLFQSVVLRGKLFAVADKGGVIFDPEVEPAWSVMSTLLNGGWKWRVVVVDEVLYSLDYRNKIMGYDPTTDKWKRLKGWNKKLPELSLTWLVNVGGILCIIWEEISRDRSKEMIMFAGIKVSRKIHGGLMGSIVWPEFAIMEFLSLRVTNCVVLEL